MLKPQKNKFPIKVIYTKIQFNTLHFEVTELFAKKKLLLAFMFLS